MTESKISIQRRARALNELDNIVTVGGGIITEGRYRPPRQLMHADASIMCLTYIPKVDVIVGGLSNGKTFLYNSTKGIIVRTLQNSDVWKKQAAITSVQTLAKKNEKDLFSSNSLMLLTTNVLGDILVWNWREKTQLHSISEPQPIYGTAICHGKLITVGKNSSVNMYDIESFQVEGSFKRTTQRDVLSGHASRVFTAKFNPVSENEFVTGGWDNLVLFWDKRRSQPIRYVFGPHICGESIDVSSDGQKLLTCSWSTTDNVQVWEYNTGKLMSTVTKDQYAPKNYSGRWATKDIAVCGGIEPNALRVVVPHENNVMGGYSNLPVGVYAIQLCSLKEPWIVPQKSGLSKRSRAKLPNEIEESIHMPGIAFCCGSHLYYASNRI